MVCGQVIHSNGQLLVLRLHAPNQNTAASEITAKAAGPAADSAAAAGA